MLQNPFSTFVGECKGGVFWDSHTMDPALFLKGLLPPRNPEGPRESLKVILEIFFLEGLEIKTSSLC